MAAQIPPTDIESQVLSAEERLRIAMLASDIGTLDELIAAELMFTNHFGQVLSKQDDLALHRSGRLTFQQLVPSERQLQIRESIAVVSVRMKLSGLYEGAPFVSDLRYTRAWGLSQNGAWQVIAGHSSAVQAEVPALPTTDLGLTHIALPVTDIDNSIRFYAAYASMQVVHCRVDANTGVGVVWLCDRTRPFVIVLIQTATVQSVLSALAHLGVGCESREQVDRLCDRAKQEGVLLQAPQDSGYPIGYWAFLRDPDGHTLELSYGQEIGLASRI
jgi:catechol 2,3-dioxygenase-like lactoylglutathione lyase family enzyme